MASCERFIDLISQSLDAPLALEDQQALQQHLEECPECRQLSQELSEIRLELHSWEEQEVPEGFAEGVMSRIRAEEQKSKVIPIWKHPQFKMFGSIAACAVICLGLWQANSPQMMDNVSISADAAAPAAEAQMYYAVSDSAAAADGELGSVAPAQAPVVEKVLPAPSGEPMMQADHTPVQYYDLSRAESKYAEQDLIQLVQSTLGEAPGTLLVVDQIPETLNGTLYTAEDGAVLLVLDAQPEDDVWKTYADSALLHLEFGDGSIVFVQIN